MEGVDPDQRFQSSTPVFKNPHISVSKSHTNDAIVGVNVGRVGVAVRGSVGSGVGGVW